jgi:TonB family protein
LASRQEVGSAQEAPKKVNISAGLAVGMLISNVAPKYPPIAKAARVSGTVVLQATISKAGTIEDLQIVSGPAMLQQAALDAVRQWHYRPYLLNNEPVEVDTTVNVIFTLGDDGQSSSVGAASAASPLGQQGAQSADGDGKYLANITQEAENGDVASEFILGYRYETGKGVPSDVQRARYWYSEAAAGGSDRAQDALTRLSVPSKAQSSDYDSQLANAMALAKAERLVEAKTAAAALVTSEPDRWEGYGLEGAVYQLENKLVAAEAAYRRALNVAPADVKPQLVQKLRTIETGAN